MALMSEKIELLAPMPSASETTATAVKPAPSGEQAGSETQIVQEMFDGSQGAHVATGLLHVIHAPHVASSPPPCVRRVVSTRHRKFLHLVEMKLQLVVELLRRRSGAAGTNEAPSARDGRGARAWPIRRYRGEP